MPPLTASQRTQRARLAALTRWGRTPDRTAATRAARDQFAARFEREVDAEFPPGSITPEQRDDMVAARRSAYFTRLHYQRSRHQQASPS
jgi:hypothetical protein